MTIKVETIGDFNDQRVDEATLVSHLGVEVSIMNWGVTVHDWRVPVAGELRSVVLGFDSFEPYPEHSPYMSQIVGRVANRIAGSSFELDGEVYYLPSNEGLNHLHGGPKGVARQVWKMESDSAANAVRFTHSSPDGAMGYPGAIDFEAVYALNGHRLTMTLSAKADRRTPISMVQHHYFNLGTGDDVLDHKIQIAAGARTEVSPALIPTGAILPVKGTEFDFRRARNLRDKNGQAIAYDGNFVLDSARDPAQPVAVVTGPDGHLELKLWTDRPGLQFYNGVTTNVGVPGRDGKRYGQYSGLCLEDQAFPDALHNAHFPSIIYGPDRPYNHTCVFEIAPLV